jgi:hypothetical protein
VLLKWLHLCGEQSDFPCSWNIHLTGSQNTLNMQQNLAPEIDSCFLW